MAIVTLTTDLGYRDPYLGIVKANLYAKIKDITLVDLACDVRNNAISDAAFILKHSLTYFPKDTIHLVAVKLIVNNSQLNQNNKGIDNTRYLLTKYKDQYLICLDNGLISLIDEAFSEPVYQIYFDNKEQHQFFMKDVFVDIAAHLAQKKPIKDIASVTDDYYKAFQFNSYKNEDQLRGKNIYTDDYGNVITNVTREDFEKARGKRNFSIILPGAVIEKISDTYDDVKFGEVLAMFNSFGLLEIAINGKSAYQMLHPRQIGKEFDFNLLIEFE